jgi:SH3 domain protein
MRARTSGRRRRAAATALLLGLSLGRGADAAWVRDEVRVKLRDGSSTRSEVIGVVKTGDRITILEKDEDWLRIRTQDGTTGYIPPGFLRSDAPAIVKLTSLEKEVEQLKQKLEETRAEEGQLRAENEDLARRDAEQKGAVEKLTAENRNLRAGERWPYLLTGAAILASGMLAGAILRSLTSERRTRRIRL